jgi:hypothetical protein
LAALLNAARLSWEDCVAAGRAAEFEALVRRCALVGNTETGQATAIAVIDKTVRRQNLLTGKTIAELTANQTSEWAANFGVRRPVGALV